VGTYFGIRAIVKFKESNRHCTSNNVCDDAGLALRDQTLYAGDVSTAVIVGGALAVAGGLTAFFLLAPRADQKKGSPPPTSAAVSVRPDGVWIGGTW
jgi:hypothetical protein